MPATTTRSRTIREERLQPVAPARNDAYTILLIISLLATLAGCVMLYLDYSKYPDAKPPTPPAASSVIKQLAADSGNAAAPAPAAGRPAK